jgi:predicted DNA binding protein
MKQAKFAVYHQGCWGSYTTEKFPEVSLRLVSPVTYLKHEKDEVVYQALWEVIAPDSASLERYLSGIKLLRDVYSMEVLQKGKLKALFMLRVKSPGSPSEMILKKGAIMTEPVVLDKGYEIYSVVSAEPSNIVKLLEELEDVGEVKILRIGESRMEPTPLRLTDKQLLAIKTALSSEYYSWPRKVTLEELARKIGMKRRAFQENLRKAEAKVFPEFIKEILVSGDWRKKKID